MFFFSQKSRDTSHWFQYNWTINDVRELEIEEFIDILMWIDKINMRIFINLFFFSFEFIWIFCNRWQSDQFRFIRFARKLTNFNYPWESVRRCINEKVFHQKLFHFQGISRIQLLWEFFFIDMVPYLSGRAPLVQTHLTILQLNYKSMCLLVIFYFCVMRQR